MNTEKSHNKAKPHRSTGVEIKRASKVDHKRSSVFLDIEKKYEKLRKQLSKIAKQKMAEWKK